MTYLYDGALCLALVLFATRVFISLRQAILAGLVFTTLTLGALPWFLLPVNGAAFAVQMGFIILACSWLLVRKNAALAIPHIGNPYAFLLLLLTCVLVAYLLVSDNPGYGAATTVWFFVKGLLPILALGALAPFDDRDLRLIVATVVVGSLLMALSLLSGWSAEATKRLTLGDESSPITVARVIGLGATLLLMLALLRSRIDLLLLYGSLAAFLLLALSLTGSRGPLVAVPSAVFAGFLFLGRGRRLKAMGAVTLILLVFLAVAALLPAEVSQSPGILRIQSRFATFGHNLSDRTRLALFQTAWDGFIASDGLGVGTGGFATLHGIEPRAYPHNLVLEVAAGQGVIGLLVLFSILLLTVRRILALSRCASLDIYSKALIGLWFYTLFNAFVSMDIAGNYFFWIAGGVVWMLGWNAEPQPSNMPLRRTAL